MLELKDVVSDVIKHTAIGFIDHVKITGSDSETLIDAMDGDRTVILKGKLHMPVSQFSGEFGFGNLGFLKGLLNLSNYKQDGAKVDVVSRQKNGVDILDHLLFQDANGNTDRYRVMGKEIIDQVLQTVKFKGAKWDVTVAPTKQKVSELQSVASIYGGIEPNFNLKIEDKNLVITIGSQTGNFAGKRVFATGITGDYKGSHQWPLSKVLTILNLGMSGTCSMSASSIGALQISVDSGIGKYDFILPALTI